jgi:D-amino-acid oxidase
VKPVAPRAVVVGGGVSGLSVGLRLLQAGFQVELRTRLRARQATSSVAAAIWYPYKVGPAEAVARWARESYVTFQELARDPATGVAMRSGLELLPAMERDPAWRDPVAGLRRAKPHELRPGYECGWVFQAPVIEMPVYLDWLEGCFARSGGRLIEAQVHELADLAGAAELIVNCAGLGARELVGDDSLVAVRGQVVRVARGGIDSFLLDDYNPAGVTYVVPRSQDCVLGGSAQEGREDLDEDPLESAAILERCRALEPRLQAARVLSVGVGLRPYRPAVRLESEPLGRALLVHDYGHGGAGVTLSWGCADEVARLVRAAFPASRTDALHRAGS